MNPFVSQTSSQQNKNQRQDCSMNPFVSQILNKRGGRQPPPRDQGRSRQRWVGACFCLFRKRSLENTQCQSHRCMSRRALIDTAKKKQTSMIRKKVQPPNHPPTTHTYTAVIGRCMYAYIHVCMYACMYACMHGQSRLVPVHDAITSVFDETQPNVSRKTCPKQKHKTFKLPRYGVEA